MQKKKKRKTKENKLHVLASKERSLSLSLSHSLSLSPFLSLSVFVSLFRNPLIDRCFSATWESTKQP